MLKLGLKRFFSQEGISVKNSTLDIYVEHMQNKGGVKREQLQTRCIELDGATISIF